MGSRRLAAGILFIRLHRTRGVTVSAAMTRVIVRLPLRLQRTLGVTVSAAMTRVLLALLFTMIHARSKITLCRY